MIEKYDYQNMTPTKKRQDNFVSVLINIGVLVIGILAATFIWNEFDETNAKALEAIEENVAQRVRLQIDAEDRTKPADVFAELVRRDDERLELDKRIINLLERALPEVEQSQRIERLVLQRVAAERERIEAEYNKAVELVLEDTKERMDQTLLMIAEDETLRKRFVEAAQVRQAHREEMKANKHKLKIPKEEEDNDDQTRVPGQTSGAAA